MKSADNPLYQRAKKFLMRRTNYETFVSVPYDKMEASLARVRDFLEFLGKPQDSYVVIHVAGTKGKGSVCGALDQIYRAAGYNVGLFTSPHIDDLMERFQINGEPCDKTMFAETTSLLVERWKTFRRARRREHVGVKTLDNSYDASDEMQMTFFEWSLVIALALFARAKVDVAILEVGLGGRFDATNVCYADVSVLTSVSYDHCEQLGNTLDEIAREKLAIVKSNAPLVCGVGFADYLYDGLDEFKRREALEPRATLCVADAARAQDVEPFDEENDDDEPIEPFEESTPQVHEEDAGENEPALDNNETDGTKEGEEIDPETRIFDDARKDRPEDYVYIADPERVISHDDVLRVRDMARETARVHNAPFDAVEAVSNFVASFPCPPIDSIRRWNFEIATRVVKILADRQVAPEFRPGANDPETTKRLPVAENVVRAAAARFAMPARFEIVSREPLIIVDGAHNRASVAAFMRAARERYPKAKIKVLLATSIGKDARGMIAELAARADEIYLTERTRDARSTPLPDLIQIHETLLDETCAENASIRRKFHVAPDFRAFIIGYCARQTSGNDILCAIGSFYFASEVRKIVRKSI